MDINKAILYGQLVNAAYAVQPNDLGNKAGQVVSAGLGASSTTFDVISSIYANDLATDMNPLRAQDQVSIGLMLQERGAGNAVIAVRGTKGIDEWIQDAKFLAVPCPFLASAGNTEDGFTAMYNSLATSTAAGSPSVREALATLPWKQPINSLTVCGHSLGGALATLLVLDVAANTAAPFNSPAVYTYASPKTGDPQFVTTYNHVVPNTIRIANRADLVPKLPLPPQYDHVLGMFELIPVKLLPLPPKILVKLDPLCSHILTTYLHLLSLLADGQALPLDPGCVP